MKESFSYVFMYFDFFFSFSSSGTSYAELGANASVVGRTAEAKWNRHIRRRWNPLHNWIQQPSAVQTASGRIIFVQPPPPTPDLPSFFSSSLKKQVSEAIILAGKRVTGIIKNESLPWSAAKRRVSETGRAIADGALLIDCAFILSDDMTEYHTHLPRFKIFIKISPLSQKIPSLTWNIIDSQQIFQN